MVGDAAHIVPPTGAKGLNLALSDVNLLSKAIIEYYKNNKELKLLNYSKNCLERVWKTQMFSSWMTHILHSFPNEDAFIKKMKQVELENLFNSLNAKKRLANNYAGKY